ncbi:hypothetical protein D9M68_811310 [compost metagenome]
MVASRMLLMSSRMNSASNCFAVSFSAALPLSPSCPALNFSALSEPGSLARRWLDNPGVFI